MKHNQYSTADPKIKSFYSIYGSFQRFEKAPKWQNMSYLSIFWPNTRFKHVCLTANGKKQMQRPLKASKNVLTYNFFAEFGQNRTKNDPFSIQCYKNVRFLNFLFWYTHLIMSARFLLARNRFGSLNNSEKHTYMLDMSM